jgi:biopolymer transport protein TolR
VSAFGRLLRPAVPKPMSEINMTPLIDVMLVLLIIFMVAAPLMGAALKLELPPAGSAEASGEAPLQLALDARGQLFWNGKPISATVLTVELTALGRNRPEAELQLAIDKAVPYGRVAELLDQLQAARLSRVAFATAPAASSP